MKSNSWKKNQVVIFFDDYSNTWVVKTKLLTRLQAIKFVFAKSWNDAMDKGQVRIVDANELNAILN
jgi:hypothetical protein